MTRRASASAETWRWAPAASTSVSPGPSTTCRASTAMSTLPCSTCQICSTSKTCNGPCRAGLRRSSHIAGCRRVRPWEGEARVVISAFGVSVRLEVDPAGNTRPRPQVATSSRTVRGWAERLVESDGDGHWVINGVTAGHLDGCFDVDLSYRPRRMRCRCTVSALPSVKRPPLAAARLTTATVERLDQQYTRVEDEDSRQRYDYEAPAFDFRCRLVYDRSGTCP